MKTSSAPSSSRLPLGASKFPIYSTHASSIVLRFSRQTGQPQINISSTPPSNKLSIGATINLTCTAWQPDDMARNPSKKPHRIEWFDPQNKPIGDKCRAGFTVASLMRCTLMVGALTDEKLGNYTCRVRDTYNYCSTKSFEIKLRGK